MAQKVHIVLEDDLDGSEATQTVSFGLDGTSYEIDLNDKNAAALRDAIATLRRSRPQGERLPRAAAAPRRRRPRPRARRRSGTGPGPTATRSPSGAGSPPASARPSRRADPAISVGQWWWSLRSARLTALSVDFTPRMLPGT